MRFVKFVSAAEPRLGMLDIPGERVVDLTALSRDEALCEALHLPAPPPASFDELFGSSDTSLSTLCDAVQPLVAETLLRGVVSPLTSLTLMAPLGSPMRNLFCIGLNYRAHLQESGRIAGQPGADRPVPLHPEIFTKPPTSVIGPCDMISRHERVTQALDYEVELAVIIGKAGREIAVEDAMAHVFGFSVANDVTGRDLQFRHGQWFKGKSLDRTCPVGPVLVHHSAIANPHDLAIECCVNGRTMQQSNTGQMIFRIPQLLADLSRGLELLPGDVVLTGTPSGVGAAQQPQLWLSSGDEVVSSIVGIGELRNKVE